MSQFLVKSPAVGVKVGGKVAVFYRGGIVNGADSADAERLVAGGHLERIAAPRPAAPGPAEPAREPSPIPAKAGPGSGKAAWRDYAESLGVNAPESADRDDLIKAVAAAGHPTE